ncbi:MAG: diacylglycerol/lipid kinase family protein [Acidobacteriota bacterium]
MKSSVSIIYNPAARKASNTNIDLAAFFLGREGFEVEVLRTDKKDHARQLAEEALKKRPSLIIAAGGDGTINEVINGLAWSGTPAAILPMGTTNVLAKELNVPEDLYRALRTAVGGTPKKVSLGKIETERGGLRYFCLMAGVGLDGKAVHDVNPSIKKVSGGAAYILSGIRNIATFSPERIEFLVDGKGFSGYTAVIGKAAKYGGNYKVTPDANLRDPFLFACIFRGGRRLDLLRYSIGVLRGTHLRYKDVDYLKASSVEILGRAHMQVDGDYLGLSPARVSVAVGALNLIF